MVYVLNIAQQIIHISLWIIWLHMLLIERNQIKQIGSSSGGVAAALYELAISKEWSIIGTVIDSDFRVKMELSNDKQAIESFKGSKYVQAYTIEALTELKRTLKADKNVLFIGTPCECEAARSVANGNEEKLLTVDLICHGSSLK